MLIKNLKVGEYALNKNKEILFAESGCIINLTSFQMYPRQFLILEEVEKLENVEITYDGCSEESLKPKDNFWNNEEVQDLLIKMFYWSTSYTQKEHVINWFNNFKKPETKSEYPKMMIVAHHSDFRYPFNDKLVIGCFQGLNIVKDTHAEGYNEYSVWRFAKEIETEEELVHLTLEDISNGKGVGVNPSLIRVKQ